MLFVDTGVWYAALDRGDRSHDRATAILGADQALLTSDYIVVETWRLVAHRLGFDVAERFWDGLRRGGIRRESVLATDLESAWAIGRRYEDQHFSMLDRTSFAVLERLGVRRVAAFDDDFAVYRYGRDASLAFELVR